MDYKQEIICSLRETFNIQLGIVQPYHLDKYDFVLMHEVFGDNPPPAVYKVLFSIDPPLYFPNVVYSKVGVFISFEALQLIIDAKNQLNESEAIKENRTIYTYVMYDSSTGCYKIGQSAKPKYRESTLQSERPTIEIILLLPINREKELHKVFKNKRVRGEWFKLDADDVLLLIEKYEFKPAS